MPMRQHPWVPLPVTSLAALLTHSGLWVSQPTSGLPRWAVVMAGGAAACLTTLQLSSVGPTAFAGDFWFGV